MKTRNEDLCKLLDIVFESAEEPDWSAVQELAYSSVHSSWLITEVFRLTFLCAQDQAAFDEAIWLLTNEA